MFAVVETLVTDHPNVQGIVLKNTKAAAIELAVQESIEQGATETPAEIADEIETEGFYKPTKHAEWAVFVYEVDAPTD